METAAETIARVLSRLGTEADVYWDMELDLIPAYNDALDEISEETEFYERYITVHRRKWAVYTDLRGVLPEEALRVTAVWNPVTQRPLEPTTVRELDLKLGRKWESNIDLARAWFMRGLWWLGTYPRPGDDTSPLRVYFSAMHPHVSIDGGLGFDLNTAPGLPPDYAEAIEEYMLYSLSADDKESKAAVDSWLVFQEKIAQLKLATGNRMQRDNIPHMGARR